MKEESKFIYSPDYTKFVTSEYAKRESGRARKQLNHEQTARFNNILGKIYDAVQEGETSVSFTHKELHSKHTDRLKGSPYYFIVESRQCGYNESEWIVSWE